DPAASSSLPNAENESRLSPVTASARNQNAGQSQEGIRRFCGGSPAGIDGRFIRNDLELGGGVDETDLAAVKETPASYNRVHLTLKLDRVRDSAAQEPDARARDTARPVLRGRAEAGLLCCQIPHELTTRESHEYVLAATAEVLTLCHLVFRTSLCAL